MIDFPDIPIFEDEATIPTFPLLIFQEYREFPFDHWVMFESLTPIEKIAIIRACRPSDLGVISDRGLTVRPQFCALYRWLIRHEIVQVNPADMSEVDVSMIP